MAVYLTIAMPLNHYDGFMKKLDASSRACEIMKNAVVERTEQDGQFVRTARILCEKGEVEMLLDHAKRLYPDALPDIRKAVDAAGESPQ